MPQHPAGQPGEAPREPARHLHLRRVHVYDAGRFCRFALVRRWNVQLEALAHRVRCSACGRRGPALKAVPDPPTAADSFPRTEQEWRLFARRLTD